MDTEIKAAAAHISRDELVKCLREMVDIPSPTGGEEDMARYLCARMAKVGMECELQYVSEGRPNAVGHLRGKGEGTNLLFTGHMDTSYDGDESHLEGRGFKPHSVEEEGWIWGLGARNMKSGLASALIAIEAIAKAGLRPAGDISFGGVVGEIEKAPIEEFQGSSFAGYGVGSHHLVTHGVTADYAILMEPTRLRMSPANMGCIWFRIIVPGTVNHSAYSSRPGVVNAIVATQELIAHLKDWVKAVEAGPSFMGERPNVTFGAIRGGLPWRISRNPFACSLYVEVRTVPGQSFETIKRELRAVLRRYAEKTGAEEPQLSTYLTDPATVIDEDLPIMDALGRAQGQVMGKRHPSIMRRPGADAVHFTVYGVPCVSFGPGGRQRDDLESRPMHEVGEHVHVDDLMTAAHIYLATALDLCNRSAGDAPAAGRQQTDHGGVKAR